MSSFSSNEEDSAMTPQRITIVEDSRFRAFLRYLADLPPYARREALEFYRAYGALRHEVAPSR